MIEQRRHSAVGFPTVKIKENEIEQLSVIVFH